MTAYKKVLLAIICIAFSILVYLVFHPKTQTFVITQFMGNMEDAEEYVRDLKKDRTFQNAKIVGKEIYVKATKAQCQKWVSNSISKFTKEMADFEENTGNKTEYEPDFSSVSFYIESIDQKTWNELGAALTAAMYHSEMIQVFSGKADWSIDILIIRPSDGKILYEVCYPKEPLDVDSKIWDVETEQ